MDTKHWHNVCMVSGDIGPMFVKLRWTHFQKYIGPMCSNQHRANVIGIHWANVFPVYSGLVGASAGAVVGRRGAAGAVVRRQGPAGAVLNFEAIVNAKTSSSV